MPLYGEISQWPLFDILELQKNGYTREGLITTAGPMPSTGLVIKIRMICGKSSPLSVRVTTATLPTNMGACFAAVVAISLWRTDCNSVSNLRRQHNHAVDFGEVDQHGTLTFRFGSGANAARVVGLQPLLKSDAIGRTWDFDRSIVHSFLPLEARPNARQGLFPDPDDICRNPARGAAKPGKLSVDNDKIVLRHHDSGFIFQRRRTALDHIKESVATGFDVRTVLDIIG
jgi:hypothetical protein